uniref:Protein kinase domain-containing protein n=1 Tax=Mucochytrium quahogii TaxID=96639 RepID=A0A7S2RWN6_9STRA|mmetsp:Transcript_21171/g.46060  ORF Transcript_21171/g.46060 Transcript_21171/m.46060 type:complete len:649 (+) Transcript_21171:271-2217(+)
MRPECMEHCPQVDEIKSKKFEINSPSEKDVKIELPWVTSLETTIVDDDHSEAPVTGAMSPMGSHGYYIDTPRMYHGEEDSEEEDSYNSQSRRHKNCAPLLRSNSTPHELGGRGVSCLGRRQSSSSDDIFEITSRDRRSPRAVSRMLRDTEENLRHVANLQSPGSGGGLYLEEPGDIDTHGWTITHNPRSSFKQRSSPSYRQQPVQQRQPFMLKERRNTDSNLPSRRRVPSPPAKKCLGSHSSSPAEHTDSRVRRARCNTQPAVFSDSDSSSTADHGRRGRSNTHESMGYCERVEEDNSRPRSVHLTRHLSGGMLYNKGMFSTTSTSLSSGSMSSVDGPLGGSPPFFNSRDVAGEKPGRRFTRRPSSTRDATSLQNRPRLCQEDIDALLLGSEIGKGSFGSVHVAINASTGQRYAVKKMKLDVDEQRTRAHESEIRVMQDLNHENIVQYLGVQYSAPDGFLYIYMEFVAGGSLSQMIKEFNAPLRDELVAKFTYQMLKGIAYLHSKNIIHRDIKGANVLVTLNGTAKLADFGCSLLLDGMNTAEAETLCRIRGSVPWMAPEVVRKTRYHFPADIWSLGATVLEMSSGKRPWPEITDPVAALFRIGTLKGPLPIPNNVGTGPFCFMSECFHIEPEKRKTAEQLLCHPFVN